MRRLRCGAGYRDRVNGEEVVEGGGTGGCCLEGGIGRGEGGGRGGGQDGEVQNKGGSRHGGGGGPRDSAGKSRLRTE